MKKLILTVIGVLLTANSVFAHHPFDSLFDAAKIHRMKGVVTLFVWSNPHSLIFMDTKDANGQTEHWAIEGPPIVNMVRMGVDKMTFKPGDTLEICGYRTKDGVNPLRSFTPPEPISLSLKSIPRETSTGQLIFPALLTLANGQKLVWSSTGKCGDPANK